MVSGEPVTEEPATEAPATGTPTIRPTREPTPSPTPKPSPLPVGNYNFPAVSDGIALDLSTYESSSGNGGWDATNKRIAINDGSPSDLTQGTWVLPSTIPPIKEGDLVKFRVQGYSYGDNGFRLWIGSGVNGGCTPIQLVNSVNPDNAVGEYPEVVNGTTKNQMAINAKSSNADVVTDTEIDGKAAGVVTRGTKDEWVTLTATAAKEDVTVTKTIRVRVLKAPAAITEDDYAGYLFGHFISESNADGEQIYFATSSDRLNFTDMNCGQPVLRSTVGEEGVKGPISLPFA